MAMIYRFLQKSFQGFLWICVFIDFGAAGKGKPATSKKPIVKRKLVATKKSSTRKSVVIMKKPFTSRRYKNN